MAKLKAPSRLNRRYGWRPPIVDRNAFRYAVPHIQMQALPVSVNLSQSCPAARDQGQLGCCSGFATAEAMEFAEGSKNILSPLFCYYNTRMEEGSIPSDAGGSIQDEIKAVATYGACEETFCPYDINNFAVKPSDAAYANGLNHKAIVYQAINQDPMSLMSALFSGKPFVGGIAVYESFESDTVVSTGDVPMPDDREDCLGGHALLFCGYDQTAQRFNFLNSWGPSYGKNGFGTIPFAYLTRANLAQDFWVITTAV